MLLAHLKTFQVCYSLFQKAEAKLVQNPQELKLMNTDLSSASDTVLRLLEDLIQFSAAGFLLSKNSAWLHALQISKQLLQSLRDVSILWARRLGMDSRLQYPAGIRSARAINDSVLSNLNNVCSVFEQLQSAGGMLETVPEGCWYFLLSPCYPRARRYLENIRQDSAPEGVPYQLALQNLDTLKRLETSLDEHKLEIASLEKQLADSHKEADKIKATVRKLQNDVLVLASASQEAHLTETKPLLRAPEMISEDVKNGIQRIAARLTDGQGEALPVERLTVEQDLIRQHRARAVETIRQLTMALYTAENKIASLEKELTGRTAGRSIEKDERQSPSLQEVQAQDSQLEVRLETATQVSQTHKSA